jgi:DNA-binding transcriptional ArsR family regulator
MKGRNKLEQSTTLSKQRRRDSCEEADHPVRVKALTILTEREASPKEISTEIDHPLSNVSYHVRVLRNLGMVEVVVDEQVRGLVKTFYKAVARSFLDDCDWEKLNPKVRTAVSAYGMDAVIKDAAEALDAGTFDKRADRHLSRTPMVLDEQGWKDALAVQAETLARHLDIQAEASERLNGSGGATGFNVIAAMVMFEMPERGSPGGVGDNG